MAILPAEVPTGLVTGQFYFVSEDNIDADTDPELLPVTGDITFTSSAKVLRMPGAKVTVIPRVFKAKFDAMGNIRPANASEPGLKLPATDTTEISPRNYTWKVEFDLKETGNNHTVQVPSFDIQVPAGTTVDLTTVMPVDQTPGTITIAGPQGAEGPAGPQGVSNIALDEDGVPYYSPGVGDSADVVDGHVVELLSNPESATSTALSATYAPESGSTNYAKFTRRDLAKLEAQRSGKLLPFHAAVANRHYKRVDIAVLGDSITEGQGATAVENRWVARLQEDLRALFPVAGVAGGRGFLAAHTTGQTSFTPPGTLSGGATGEYREYGAKRSNVRLDTAGETVTFNVNGTSCDVVYLQASSGVLGVSVDGGAVTTFSTNGAFLDGKKYRVTFGSAGAHTVAISYSSGAACFVSGIVEYNGDENKGIQVNDCGHYGWDAGTGGSGWRNTNTQDWAWPSAIASLGADLLIIALGTNDSASSTPAQFQANIQALIAVVRAGYVKINIPTPVIALLPYGGRSSAAATWPEYVESLHNVAAADDAVVVADLSHQLPNASTNPGMIYADGVSHPTNKGHALIADLVRKHITV